MEKVIRDGKVAVLVSPDFGAGWYSWNNKYPQLLFNPKLVEMVEQNRKNEITDEWVKENLDINIYTGGASDLEIHWLPQGTAFYIEEYDGSENLVLLSDLNLIA